jgi:PKHD-type hydroxylase
VDSPLMGFPSRGLAPVGNNYVRSDLSMTLFLSAPGSYEGGELVFGGPFCEVKVKLEAGSAVLYPTGARHSVAPVTRGVRHAAIVWVQSLFPVESHRQVIHNARQLMSVIGSRAPGSEEFKLAKDNFYNTFRILAQV